MSMDNPIEIPEFERPELFILRDTTVEERYDDISFIFRERSQSLADRIDQIKGVFWVAGLSENPESTELDSSIYNSLDALEGLGDAATPAINGVRNRAAKEKLFDIFDRAVKDSSDPAQIGMGRTMELLADDIGERHDLTRQVKYIWAAMSYGDDVYFIIKEELDLWRRLRPDVEKIERLAKAKKVSLSDELAKLHMSTIVPTLDEKFKV